MRIYFLAVVLAFFAIHCGERDQPAVPQRTFAWLPKGDTLEVTYASVGRSHNDSYRFVFQHPHDYTATVTILHTHDSTEDGKELGTITLTHEEMEGLDNLFRLYRANIQGSCTTEDRITVVRRHDGNVLSTEEFIDNACVADQMQMEDAVTSLGEIVGRARRGTQG